MKRRTIRPVSGTASQAMLKPFPSLFGQAVPIGVQLAESPSPVTRYSRCVGLRPIERDCWLGIWSLLFPSRTVPRLHVEPWDQAIEPPVTPRAQRARRERSHAQGRRPSMASWVDGWRAWSTFTHEVVKGCAIEVGGQGRGYRQPGGRLSDQQSWEGGGKPARGKDRLQGAPTRGRDAPQVSLGAKRPAPESAGARP
jgi:hypothetical protein